MARIALTRVLPILFLLTLTAGAVADVLLIEQVRQAGRMEVPVNGLSMSEVEGRFGTPQEKQAAVGDPPISRWVYDRWSVYFEYDRVLYTVLHEGEVIESLGESGFESGAAAESEPEPESDSDQG